MNGRNEQASRTLRRTNTGRCAYQWIARLSLLALAIAGLGGCVTAQERSYGIRTLQLTKFGGHADFVVRHRERELKSKTGDTETRSEETIFEESLSLEAKGYAFHPNILELALGGVFGLVQEDFTETVDGRKRSDSHYGDLTEFDLDAQILKKRAYPMTVFAHRRRGIVPRPFRPSLETTTRDYGFTWQYVSKKTPTSLRFNHTETTLSPLFILEQEEEGRQETTELRLESEYHYNDTDRLSFTYTYESVDEEPYNIKYDADEVTLSHDLTMGGKRRHNLRSEFNYLDQRGTIPIKRTRWREDLRLVHSDSLASRFRFELLDRTRGSRSATVADVKERSYRLTGSLRHQLFDSQTTQFQAFVQKQEFEPDLQITRWGGQFNFNYRKTNPWGILHANYAARLERTDQRGETRTAEVIDEVHTFRDPEPIVLGSRNVDVSSITIRAEDRVTFYQQGRDFTRRDVGDIVEIERVATGRIADGETVLIDYQYDVGGSFELDTVSQNFAIRQDFDFGLTPYYQLEWQDQTIRPADATSSVAEDLTAHVAGVEYEKASLRLFAEYEDRDSTISPLVSSRVGASYAHRFRTGAETSMHARWTDTTYDPPNQRDVTLLTLEARHRHPIIPGLTVEGSVYYRNGEDSVSGDTDGIDMSVSLEWFVNQMEIRMSYERSEYEDEFALNDSSALFVHIKRGF